ncbi:MAG TPA: transaldolase family protein [Candidatus Limnocylindria bacterium]|nr:transaldolase family protein [Candidatus Limnocylindria bacterium]
MHLSTAALADTLLGRTIGETPTDIWNDSCNVDELRYAVDFGAVGATANPTIVVDNWRTDPDRWAGRVHALAAAHPTWSERDLAWGIVAEMSAAAAPLLLPAFTASGGRAGRLSIQTDPTLHRDAAAMVDQAAGFVALAPNVIVKFPATAAGIEAMEEASYRGISVNATVSFSVAQAVAAAEAVERGLVRREAEGRATDDMGPVITIMMGRLEDWLRETVDREGLTVHPAALPWSGVAVFKRAYWLWGERRFRARLLGAAIRHHLHWSELIGGDVVITLPSAWQKRFNASSVEVRSRIGNPVDADTLQELATLPDFRAAYEPDGLRVADFDGWGPTRRTLRAFTASYHDLLHLVGEALLA